MLLLHNLARARLTRSRCPSPIGLHTRFFPSGFSSPLLLPQLPLSHYSLSLSLSHSSCFHLLSPSSFLFSSYPHSYLDYPLDSILIDFPIRVLLSPTLVPPPLYCHYYYHHSPVQRFLAYSLPCCIDLRHPFPICASFLFFFFFQPSCAPFHPYCFVSALRLASNILV